MGHSTVHKMRLKSRSGAAASVFVMEISREAYGAQTDPMLSYINVGRASIALSATSQKPSQL